MNFCHECGERVTGAKFCSNCGTPLNIPRITENQKDHPTSTNTSAAGFEQGITPSFRSPAQLSDFMQEFGHRLAQSPQSGVELEINDFADVPRVLAKVLQHEMDYPDEISRSIVFGVHDILTPEMTSELDQIRLALIGQYGEVPEGNDGIKFLGLGNDFLHSASLYTVSKSYHQSGNEDLSLHYALLAIITAFSATEVLSAAIWCIANPIADKWDLLRSQPKEAFRSQLTSWLETYQPWIALASASIRWSLPRIVFSGDYFEEVNVSKEVWLLEVHAGCRWLQWAHRIFDLDGQETLFGHPGAVVEAIGTIWETGDNQERQEAERALRRIKEIWHSSRPSGVDPPESFAPAQKYLRFL